MNYILSPNGSVVYRFVPISTISASSFNTRMLPKGYASTVGNSGSMSVTSYSTGYDRGGGAQFEALYSLGADLPANQALQWIQVITTNDPLGGVSSPYLDNAANRSQPFYSYTQQNRSSSLLPNQLNFYDYSRRAPGDLAGVNPITWSANLYPVIWNTPSNSLAIENGTSWGWTAKSAMLGTDSGIFASPAPTSATVTGVGTSHFTWGSGIGGENGSSSSLSFAGSSFNAQPNTPFKLGTITYFNGQNENGADSVHFQISVNLANVPEKDFVLDTPITLVNTPNTSDPIASADTVSLVDFGDTFHVEEDQTATADIYATLFTNLTGAPATGASTDSLFSTNDTLGSNPNYALSIFSIQNASPGGFITTLGQNNIVLTGLHTSYQIAFNPSTGKAVIVDTVAGRDGTQTVANLHDIIFPDGIGRFDTTGDAEEAARLYQAALGRAPDASGLDYWTARLDSHTLDINGVALGFINSAEFQAKYGSLDNKGFVDQLYTNVLHRAPEASGEQFWISQLNSGTSQAQVLGGFSDSLENKINTQGAIGDPHMDEAYRLYQAAFNRTPDMPGLSYWTGRLDNGSTPFQVAQGFTDSTEFAKFFAGVDTKGFVDLMYHNVLHRAADASGEAYWIGQLNSDTSKAPVLLGFSDSLENRLNTSQATHDGWVSLPS